MNSLLHRLNYEMANALQKAAGSLVQVRSGRGGAGAGTIWHPQGLIVTNAHVVARGALRVLLPDGTDLPARILTRDEGLDIAVLEVDRTGLPTIEPGESRRLKPGHWVLALGHPWGVSGAVTAGIVIGVGSEWPEGPTQGRDWIAVSMPLRPGNSGGPLIDVRGRLLGINTMITGPEVGMAVPVHVVKRFLREALGSRESRETALSAPV